MSHSIPPYRRASENTYALYRDFFRIWCKVRRQYPFKSKSEVTAQSICHVAPEWYLPARTAQRELRMIALKGVSDYDNPNPIRKAMFISLYSRLKQAMEKNPAASRYSLLQNIISSEAPCFFISMRTATRIINKSLKNGKY